MNAMPETADGTTQLPMYLLTIRGTLAPATLEAARAVHNETAGAPANVAAAKALGDLSHMVYVPTAPESAGEFLILDVWNNMDGLGQFFANPHVQEQAGQIFASRDPVVWAPAAGFVGYHLPAPYGKNDRVVVVVRGMVHSHTAAQRAHNAVVASLVNATRQAGALSHEAYFRMAPPNTPEALEFCAVDVWADPAGLALYAKPEFGHAIGEMLAGPPSISTWTHPAGSWVEW